MDLTKFPPLTNQNAPHALTIINIQNPEWGIQRFNYRAQPLTDNNYAHTFGVGSNSAVLFDDNFKFWAIVSFTPICLDIKFTVWERLILPGDTDITKLINTINEQGVKPIYDDELSYDGPEILGKTKQYMQPTDKAGGATIEISQGQERKWNNAFTEVTNKV